MEEIWKDIEEYNNLYRINNYGEIRKSNNNKIICISQGRIRVTLKGEYKSFKVKDLMIKYFGVNICSLPNEKWESIFEYEGKYMISDLGRVYSITSDVFLSANDNGHGYLNVMLSDLNNYRSRKYIHRLVATAFIENPLNLPEVNHKDEDHTNNKLDNLEWCDRTYNMNYGTVKQRLSDKLINNIHTSKPVIAVEIKTGEILEFESTKDAHRNGFHFTNVCKCCNNKIKSYKGYKWYYKENIN